MGFFYTSSSAPAPSRAKPVIPVRAMNEAGCSACPRDRDKALEHPKLEFHAGEGEIDLAFLVSSRTREDDLDGAWMSRAFEDRLAAGVGKSLFPKHAAFMGTTRCALGTPSIQELECCRGHIERWVRDLRPKVIVALGDEALTWATAGRFTSVAKWGGRLVSTVISGHACWVIGLQDEETLLRRRGNKDWETEHDRLFDHQLRVVREFLNRWVPPGNAEDARDQGIEVLDTTSPGALEKLREFLVELNQEPRISLDIETRCLRPYEPEALLLTMAVGTFDRTMAFPIMHPRGWKSSDVPRVLEIVREFLLNSPPKICHSVGFEMEWLAHVFGHELLRRTEWEDTRAQAFVLDERPGTHSLDNLVSLHFGFQLKALSSVNVKNLLHADLYETLKYNALDTKWTAALFDVQQKLLEEEDAYLVEYERLMRLAPTLVLSQLRGVPVSRAVAEEKASQLQAAVDKAMRLVSRCPEVDRFTRQFGAFNPTSPDHVVKLLRDVCNRQEVFRGGKLSSDESVLSSIPPGEVPSAKYILELREVEKLLSTYITPALEGRTVYSDGLMHAIFNALVTVTGRLSCDSPNLQNFPKRKHKHIRAIVRALAKHLLVSIDYGQIEARVIAMASEDPVLVEALWTGYDIHAFWGERFADYYPPIYDATAAEYDIDPDDTKRVLKQLRQEAKNKWVFPQFYGASHRSCAKSLGIPEDVALKIAKEFWAQFKGVKKWQDRLITTWERKLYVETLTGRRRRGAMSRNELLNTPIQGTASDIVTGAMSELSEYADSTGLWHFQPIMNIHDDLTFMLPTARMDEDLPIITDIMLKKRYKFINVPLLVEISAGPSWDDQEELRQISSE